MREGWWLNSKDMNHEQRAVVQTTAGGNYLITGPPGSGKTNALMLRAEYLNKRGDKDYLAIVFTRGLKQFVSACPGAYSMPTNKLKTLNGWLLANIHMLDGQVAATGKFTLDRRANVAMLHSLLESTNITYLVDTLFLDEAQDFTRDEVALFRRAAKNIYAVADAKQRIYEEGGGLETLREFCEELALTYHYRNGRAICKVADHIGQVIGDYTEMSPTSQYVEGDMPSSVEHFYCSALADQIERIAEAVQSELEAYPNGLIGILTPRREEVAAITAALREYDFWPLTTAQGKNDSLIFTDDTRVCVCTIHTGKGLEFRTVHIACADKISVFRREQWQTAYTAVTRAKTKLSVYYHSPLPTYLEAALEAGKEHKEPTTDDLFI